MTTRKTLETIVQPDHVGLRANVYRRETIDGVVVRAWVWQASVEHVRAGPTMSHLNQRHESRSNRPQALTYQHPS